MEAKNIKKPYFRISVDYEGTLGYFSLDNCNYGCDNDELILEGYDETPFVVPGIEEWCYEWNEFNGRYVHGEIMTFDWADWQRRGRDFGQKLRQIVPDEIDIFYSCGKEEIHIQRINNFQIHPNFGYEIGYCDGVSTDCEEDILHIGWFKPIHIPGIYNWWKDFDLHVDYVENTADPNFDWATWYAKGLTFATEIRTKLHPSVSLWYRCPFELRDIFPVRDLKVQLDGSFKVGDFLKEI